MKNEILRKRLNEVLDTYGMKLNFVANQIDINYTYLCKFKNGKLDVPPKNAEKIEKFLEKFDKQAV